LGAGGNSILTEVAESIANAKLAFERARAELADAKEELNRAHGRLEAAIKHYEETCKAAQGSIHRGDAAFLGRFCTLETCHRPPRADRTPLPFSATAENQSKGRKRCRRRRICNCACDGDVVSFRHFIRTK